MANKKGTGLLMVWADIPGETEEEFNRWYNEEHLGNLLSTPGVLDAARYMAVSGGPKYLACYELESLAVMESEEFREHIENPTEWSKRMSPRVSATNYIGNTYQQIFPDTVSPDAAQAGMAPALQIGRMGIPADVEDEFNRWYNTGLRPQLRESTWLHTGQALPCGEGGARVRGSLRVRAREGLPEPRVGRRQRRPSGFSPDAVADDARGGLPRHL